MIKKHAIFPDNIEYLKQFWKTYNNLLYSPDKELVLPEEDEKFLKIIHSGIYTTYFYPAF